MCSLMSSVQFSGILVMKVIFLLEFSQGLGNLSLA